MHDSGWNVQKIANLNELKNGSAIEITYIQTKLYSYVNIFFGVAYIYSWSLDYGQLGFIFVHQEQEIHLTIRFRKTKANLGLQLFYCVQGHHQGDNRRGEVLKVDRDWKHIKVTF